jgi:hypothetical protein
MPQTPFRVIRTLDPSDYQIFNLHRKGEIVCHFIYKDPEASGARTWSKVHMHKAALANNFDCNSTNIRYKNI